MKSLGDLNPDIVPEGVHGFNKELRKEFET